MDTLLYSLEVTADNALKIRQLAELGVFAMKSGSCEIHFDSEGKIVLVSTHMQKRVIPNIPLVNVALKGDIV